MRRIYGVGMGMAAMLCSSTAWAQKYDGSGSPTFIPHTLQEALASAYLTNPTLQQARATLRATDEQVPTALAGWRPTVSGTAGLTYYQGTNDYQGSADQPGYLRMYNTPGYTAGVTITQPLYTGGKTTASTHQAVNKVMAARANLISVEQQVFKNVVNAYVSVIEDEQLLQLNINNERVLQQQLRATNERFKVGEITRTDVAQAESAYASSKATRQQSEGTLQTAQATYMQIVGMAPPPNLVPPQPLVLPVKNEQTAAAMAVKNNPDVINALFTESSQKDAVSVAMAAIMPKVSATAAYSRQINQSLNHQIDENKYAMLNFNIPIYQGGSEYAAVRQAKQQAQAAHREVDIQRRTVAQDAVSNWQKLVSYQAAISSNRAAIKAGTVALDGVERQAIVGTSTTLEVLQQQETLLQAQVALVQSLSNMVIASYNVASAIGRLTAADLQLNVPLYDDKAYYKAVKDRLWGINDYAVGQPGR
ncbi:TolC family outer membrane protein [Acetobacter orleanensis]|uniref:Type I secretion protein TolC n=1 Tax=Acetobacter orleanensis TaxID=104099 RepID=A0A4Y3TJC1_9PROT|nr:TolC family outer membrane protein [Acetobacter orleanensis]KXV63132.1 secretion protein [Acetobacter orleanensis]PCD80241.1 secretion protein [Acetobacter orleanensis]GAN69023.1 secretion system type I outer membrane protein TolC [Acetobacter orleanensis JCM 7639]GBR30390.1 secretion system type I outer membrane protein TolC [Acetobacter orleanensis NRIC 0473]GEB81569.1 type I secretion protein TolC [Acetobacter orleanensis]